MHDIQLNIVVYYLFYQYKEEKFLIWVWIHGCLLVIEGLKVYNTSILEWLIFRKIRLGRILCFNSSKQILNRTKMKQWNPQPKCDEKLVMGG